MEEILLKIFLKFIIFFGNFKGTNIIETSAGSEQKTIFITDFIYLAICCNPVSPDNFPATLS